MVSLDGGNRVVGTEIIKLLSTGSSDLATEEYVLEQVALGGGAIDAYTKGEVNALLSGDLNVSSLQSTNNIQTATTLKCNNFEKL